MVIGKSVEYYKLLSYHLCMFVCVLAVYNKAQIISNREFKLWTFLQGTESRVATFLAETFVMSHQSPNRENLQFSNLEDNASSLSDSSFLMILSDLFIFSYPEAKSII